MAGTFSDAKDVMQCLLSKINPKERPRLIDWMKNADEPDNDNHTRYSILESISEYLRTCLPVEAMLSSETMAIQKTQQNPQPTVHVDAFLYDEDAVDTLCEEGKMSRNYCLQCGSQRTAPLWRHSHSFSILELKFLFQHALPDLRGKLVVDVGSRLGAVLYGGHVYSTAARLVGVEISAEFVRLQNMAIEKYGFSNRIQVIHADVRTQDSLIQNADVLVMNNVFEYFLEPQDQIKAWEFIFRNFRKKGALLVTVPSLQQSFSSLQITQILVDPGHQLVEQVIIPLDYNDEEAFKEIHLYRVV